jgi:hypothetical protein
LSVRKVVPLPEVGRRELGYFSDASWARITKHIAEPLPPETDARLRDAVTACCSWLLTQQMRLKKGADTAGAMRSPGKGQPAPLERVAKGLRMAANACAQRSTVKRQLASSVRVARGLRMAADGWAQIGDIFDDRLSDIGQYRALATLAQAAEQRAKNGKHPPATLSDRLTTMARDAERRLAGIRALGAPVTVPDPWLTFVRHVERCCRKAGLDLASTGRVYLSSWGIKPTWFQAFMAALDKNLLGGRNLVCADRERDHTATYAAIAKARSGKNKPPKAQH